MCFFPQKKLYPILYQLRCSYFFYNIIFNSFCLCGHSNKLERGSVITLYIFIIHSSPPVFNEVHVTRYLVLCVCFVDRCSPFGIFLLVIVLSVHGLTDSDYPFGVYKHFFIACSTKKYCSFHFSCCHSFTKGP